MYYKERVKVFSTDPLLDRGKEETLPVTRPDNPGRPRGRDSLVGLVSTGLLPPREPFTLLVPDRTGRLP